MLENTQELVSGMKVLLTIFPNAKGIFAVEDNKRDCIEKLEEAIQTEERMDVKAMMTKYPQGAERQLIYTVTKRAIHSAMLPADAGCIVDNVETLISIHRAVIEGRPLTERVVTVSGDAVNSPGNFKVLLGTSPSGTCRSCRRFFHRTGKTDFRRTDDGICDGHTGRTGNKNIVFPACL